MHTKYSAAALVASASATAVRGPLPDASFPKFSTLAPPASPDLDSNNNVLIQYSKNLATGGTLAGPYRGFRNDLHIFPTQNVA